MPAVGKGRLPRRASNNAANICTKDVNLVLTARHRVNGRASGKVNVPNYPASSPVRRDRRIPRRRPYATIGADNENVELIATAGDCRDCGPWRSTSASDLPPTVPAVCERWFPSSATHDATSVSGKQIEFIGTAAHDVYGRAWRQCRGWGRRNRRIARPKKKWSVLRPPSQAHVVLFYEMIHVWTPSSFPRSRARE